MGDLTLHIGTPKTGTTSLQQFLFNSRKKLVEHGVHYPVFTDQNRPHTVRNGIFLNRYCHGIVMGAHAKGASDIEENLGRLAKSLSEHEQTLLTSEDFSSPNRRFLKHEQLREHFWSTVAQVVREAGARNIMVVVYLRRQDDWAASQWRQHVKTGRTNKALADYCAQPLAHYAMDYLGLLDSIETGFGKGVQIVVRRYDRASFEGGDIFHDFCAATGIPWDDGYRLPKGENNQSLSFDVAEALRPFATVAPIWSTPRLEVIIPLARKLSRQNPDPPATTPFEEGTARLLMEPFLTGNALVAERYLGGGPLFSDAYGNRPVWEPNKERITTCRAAFEEAMREYKRQQPPAERLHVLTRELSEGVKRPVRALVNRLAERSSR